MEALFMRKMFIKGLSINGFERKCSRLPKWFQLVRQLSEFWQHLMYREGNKVLGHEIHEQRFFSEWQII